MSDRVPITFVNDWTGSEITLRLEPLRHGALELTSAATGQESPKSLMR